MMTTRSDETLIVEVARIVRRAAKIPQRVPISAESSLFDDLRIDSLDFVAVILQLQDYFDVVIEEDAVPHLCRVADLAAYLAERRESVRS
jgi:acyl carrier protein